MTPPLGDSAPTSYGSIVQSSSVPQSPSLLSARPKQNLKEGERLLMDSLADSTAVAQHAEESSAGGSLWDDQDELERKGRKLLQKVDRFTLFYNPDKGYRATELRPLQTNRPHMRAFHASWVCFFCSWLIWFSVAPLLPYIQASFSTRDHAITKADVWTSNLWSMAGAVVLRLVLGPLCDQHGGRVILTTVLGFCAVLCGSLGLASSWSRFVVWRTLLGCVGGTLVPAQYWVTSHFVSEICGTTMAMVAGWGAMGGGVAQILMGSMIFPLCLNAVGGNADVAWRVALLVPAGMALVVAALCFQYADDGPLGSIQEVQKAGLLQARSAVDSFRSGALHLNAWLLFLQFGAGLGIELTMECGISVHLAERFDLSLAHASSLASLFGLMNIFARGLGGWISDQMHRRYSLRGRLYVHWLFMVLEGILVFVFCRTTHLSSTLVAMVFFAALGQMSMGTCFGIVPYVDPVNTGTIAGIVGAGGNVGAIWLSSVFRSVRGDLYAFQIMGSFCIAMSLLTPLIVIKGYQGICFGKERPNRSNSLNDSNKKLLVLPSPLLVPRNVLVVHQTA